jgi:hypothetical protein
MLEVVEHLFYEMDKYCLDYPSEHERLSFMRQVNAYHYTRTEECASVCFIGGYGRCARCVLCDAEVPYITIRARNILFD